MLVFAGFEDPKGCVLTVMYETFQAELKQVGDVFPTASSAVSIAE